MIEQVGKLSNKNNENIPLRTDVEIRLKKGFVLTHLIFGRVGRVILVEKLGLIKTFVVECFGEK